MMPSQAVELLGTLKEKPLTLKDVYERMRTTGSSWTLEQLQLFLMCAPGVRHDRVAGTFDVVSRDVDEELKDALLEAVRSFAGKPVPAAQVRARLPNHFVTTDEQILAIARRTPGLEIFGPKLIRIAQ
jgi:hypothetical protein